LVLDPIALGMETYSRSTYPFGSGDVNPNENSPSFIKEMSKYVMTLSEKNDWVEDKVNKLEGDINGIRDILTSLELSHVRCKKLGIKPWSLCDNPIHTSNVLAA